MSQYIDFANKLVWGAPALVLILGVGLFLSMRTGFVQLRLFPKAFRLFLDRLGNQTGVSGISPFQALCTALAGTMGTGNLVGVAGAIALGGPGAVFWMWASAVFGMMTKFAEATLALHFREKRYGQWIGGPMHMISNGLGKKWRFMATAYCVFGIFASFGVGNAAQINAVVTGFDQAMISSGGVVTFRKNLGMGLLLAVLIGSVLLGGAKRIGKAAQLLVPIASCVYLALGIGVLITRFSAIPDAFAAIFQGAFSPRAVTGGMTGSCFQTIRIGVSRGVFTNEAGMGTASIAHASANVRHPAEQGMMGILEVFLDTVVVCTMTALVILCSGIAVPYGTDMGAALTAQAFSAVYGDWVSILLTIVMCCFAVATVLGWGLYGVRCAEFLFGSDCSVCFALLQTVAVVAGSILETGTIWSLAELFNGLMAIPNLITLVALSPVLQKLTTEYELQWGGDFARGGTYENFNQCKPLSAFSHAQIPSLRAGGKKTG